MLGRRSQDGCAGATRSVRIKRYGTGTLDNSGKNNTHRWLDFGGALQNAAPMTIGGMAPRRCLRR